MADPRTKVINEYQWLVDHMVKRYSGYGVDRQDLRQEGLMGLVKAWETFDPERGTQFKTHAFWEIRCSVQRFIRQEMRIQNPMMVGVKEQTKKMGIKRYVRRPFERLDEPARERGLGDGSNGWTMGDMQPSPDPGPEDLAMHAQHLKMAREAVRIAGAQASLDKKAVTAIVSRNHTAAQQTHRQIGFVFGVSRQRVQKIESELLNMAKELAQNLPV